MAPEDKEVSRTPFWRRVKQWLVRFFSFLERVLPKFFGVVHYQAPPWLRRLKAAAAPVATRVRSDGASLASDFTRWRKANPRRMWGITAGVIALLIAGEQGYHWWKTRPRPVEFTVTGSEPKLTPLEPDAVPDPVHIYFSGSAAPLAMVGKTVAKGITMKPAHLGAWHWASDRELVFTPKSDWEIGQTYKVWLEKSLFPSHVRLEKYDYVFHSAPFSSGIESSEFYQDPKQPKVKQVVATVKFSHPVDTVDFEKRVTLTFKTSDRTGLIPKSEKWKFTVSYDKMKGKAFIQSDSIPIPWRDSTMEIAIAKGVRAARGGKPSDDPASATVTVPGMYTYFTVQSLEPSQVRNAQFEPEQVLILDFSAGVRAEEVAKYLKVYLLPVDRPKTKDREAVKRYSWSSPQEIGPEVLKLSQLVTLDPIPTELEFSKLHTFRYKAPVGRYLYAVVKNGAHSYGDYILASDFSTIHQVPPFPKELKIMHDGALLALSGSRKLSLLSRDIPGIHFEVGRVVSNQINHLITQTGGSFTNPSFNNWNFGEDNIAERFTEDRALAEVEEGKTQYSAFDFSSYLDRGGQSRKGLFFLKVSAWDPENKNSYPPQDKRFILVTDLGLLVKDNKDQTHDVFVQSIYSGQPVSAATVEVLGKNGVPVATASTDAEGHARLPSLQGLEREKQPTVYVVRRGEDFSFLPFRREDRRIDFSRFDTGGEISDITGSTLTAFLFSDRGIYRPGDELHAGIIVKSSDWRKTLAGVPLEEVITDPRGIEIFKRKINLSAQGFEELSYRTLDTSPTGQYGVQLYIVKDKRRDALLGSTSVRVEEFLPDRMRITTHFSEERLDGWVHPKELSARVTLKTLFGIPATKRQVVAEMSLTPASPYFRPFKEFQFHDPLKTTKSFNESLGSQETDSDGEAKFDLDLGRFEGGIYRVRFIAEGHEAEGGRGVSAESTVLVSPLEHLIGFKADGDLHYINKGSARSVKLIAVSPEMKQVAVEGLTAHLIQNRYVSTLVKQENGTYKYESVRKEVTISKKPLSIAAAGLKYPLATGQEGDYSLVLRDADERELNRVDYSVVGHANLTRNLEKNAELQLKLSKPDYSPGEDIELQILAPYTGHGLITIEREKVYAHKWFHTTTTSSIEHIKLPPGIEGNAYVSVSFVRSIDSKEIFMSPLSYAAQPFSISLASRVNRIDLDVPDRARPGEPFHIKYKTQRPGKIAIFAVDEGILQVARYATPDPLSFFFKKRALEVRTSQILDLILPEYELVHALLAPGGGEGEAALGKNLNPFKRKREAPVAYWSGILTSTGAPSEVIYQVPDYFSGTLRVMAVAVSPDSLGVDSKKSFIKGPFVLSPNVPTFVAPGDKFEVSVSVANNVEGSGDKPPIEVGLETSTHLEAEPKTQTITVGEGKEETTHFQVKARDRLGSATLKFTTKLGDRHGHYSVDLSVRPAVPYRVSLQAGSMQKETREIPITRKLYNEFRTKRVALSVLPLGLSSGLLQYLEDYPYGCTEQLVSKAFPALVLRTHPEFGVSPDKVQKRLDETIAVLRSRQTESGAFGFWAANSYVSDFQVVYAAHFLTEARESGFPVPKDLLDNALGYLKTIAGKDDSSPTDMRVASYAIYVLTRNGIVTTSFVSELRRRLDLGAIKEWRKDLAGFYLAATYQLLQQRDEASAILRQAKIGNKFDSPYEAYYDALTRDAQLVYLYSRHFPERLKALTPDDLSAVIRPLVRGSYNTIDSSYAILALAAYTSALQNAGALDVNAQLVEINSGKRMRELAIPRGLFPRTEISEQAEKLRLTNRADLGLFYMLTEAGFDVGLPAEETKNSIEVQREFRSSVGKTIDELAMGEEAEVHLKVRALSGSYSNVALVDLLPGGFEVVMDSLRPVAAAANDSDPNSAAAEAPPEGEGDVASPPPEEGEGEPPPLEQGEGEGEGAFHRARKAPIYAGFATSDTAPDSGIGSFTPDYTDIREDRVVTFGNVSSDALDFVYRIRATNRGTFVVPPPFAESMYQHDVWARGKAATITVK